MTTDLVYRGKAPMAITRQRSWMGFCKLAEVIVKAELLLTRKTIYVRSIIWSGDRIPEVKADGNEIRYLGIE